VDTVYWTGLKVVGYWGRVKQRRSCCKNEKAMDSSKGDC
jgi:hypothetical protein